MKIRVYLLSGLVLALFACKESKKISAGEPMAGTPLSLQLPSGFYREPDKNLFVHNMYDANISVNSLPIPYDTSVLDFSKEQLEAVGQKLISIEPVVITGVKGLLCQTSLNIEGSNFKRWRLVLPEGSSTLTVAGTFSIVGEKDLSSPIKNMLLAAYMNPDWKPDMSQLDFTVQPAEGLKLAKMLEGPAVMYTADGSWTNSSIYACSFLCGSSYTVYVQRQTDYTEKSFRQICPKCVLDKQDSLVVDGLEAKEIWGTEKDPLTTRLRYEAIVFDSLKCYYLIGTAEKDNQSRLEEFRSSVRTWRKKGKGDSIKAKAAQLGALPLNLEP